MATRQHRFTIRKSVEIAPGVVHLFLTTPDGPAEHLPGQFVMAQLEDSEGEFTRSYSFSELPGSDANELVISRVNDGRGSEIIFGLTAGDELSAKGPFGRFVLRNESPQRYIMLATGTGIAPFRAMLPELRRRIAEEGAEVIICQGARERSGLLFGDEFKAFAAAHERARYYACLSRDESVDAEQHECAGRLTMILEQLGPNAESDIVYLCGNPDMIDESIEMLKARNFTPRQIRREKYFS